MSLNSNMQVLQLHFNISDIGILITVDGVLYLISSILSDHKIRHFFLLMAS